MANLHLKKELISAIENQITANDPPCSKEIYEKLQAIGYSKTVAKEKIAAVLLEEMYYMLKDGRTYDEKVYEQKIKQLLDSSAKKYGAGRNRCRKSLDDFI